MIYSFFLKRMEIEKVRKFVSNLHDKTEYVMDMRNLKQSLNQGLVLNKVHRIIKLSKKVS